MSKYCPAVPDGREYGGVGAHGVGAHPGLADVVKTSAEEGGHDEMICQDCQRVTDGCLVCLSKSRHLGEDGENSFHLIIQTICS